MTITQKNNIERFLMWAIVALLIPFCAFVIKIREDQVINTERIIRHDIEADRWKEYIEENNQRLNDIEKIIN